MFRKLLISGIVLLYITGCTPRDTEKEQVPGWVVTLSGIRSDVLEEKEFTDAKEHDSHHISMELEKKGELHIYKGMPFSKIASMVDGSDSHHPYEFDSDLWESGYDITIIAADGYSVTFNTADVSPEDIILSDTKDGELIPLQTAGNVSGSLWVKNVTSILFDLGTTADEEVFELQFEVNGELFAYTLKDLEESPYFIEDRGRFTTSAGTTYEHTYSGVIFADFLSGFISLKKETAILVTAMDGYELSYSGEEILDDSEGVWILAFKADGEYLPMDPGYIRTVKVGPESPDIDGRSSAKMIAKITISGEPYNDFILSIRGKMEAVLDRKTIQTGISCHKVTVSYYNKKTEITSEYTGIPLWRLLSFSDDPDYAPHKQDSDILSYNDEAAAEGYSVKITAGDGFEILLDSKELNNNDDVIIAMYKDGEELTGEDWPLMIIWDSDAELIPEGIKTVHNITGISLIFD